MINRASQEILYLFYRLNLQQDAFFPIDCMYTEWLNQPVRHIIYLIQTRLIYVSRCPLDISKD